MFFNLVCLLTVTCVFAAPPLDVAPEKQQPTVIPIISQSSELDANGTYKFSYETGNGIRREETSYDKVLPPKPGSRSANSDEGGEDSSSDENNEIHVQQGSYSYTAPDGTLITVRYIADENGFQILDDHLSKAPGAAGKDVKSGRQLKPADNDEVGSAPAPIVASTEITNPAEAAPVPADIPKTAEEPKLESRIASTASSEAVPSSASEASPSPSDSASTAGSGETASSLEPESTAASEEPTSSPGPVAPTLTETSESSSELTSTAATDQTASSEPALTTTSSAEVTSAAPIEESASTSEAVSSTISEEAVSAPEVSSTPALDEPLSTSEAGSTLTSEEPTFTSEAASTSTSGETVSTSEAISTPSTDEPASTSEAASTPVSEATTDAASTISS